MFGGLKYPLYNIIMSCSQKTWKEFKEYINHYEQTNGIQNIDSIRNLSRMFAISKSPQDHKKAQPLYYRLFISICNLRNINLPADFNDDNHYDPDGLYTNDKDINKKLKAFNKRVNNASLELINSIHESNE
jgi:hypothetical protein